MSHWRGAANRWTQAAWTGIGLESLRLMQGLQHATQQEGATYFTPQTFLEWGPGGGSNVYAFLPIVKRAYGIDISQQNLNETARVTEEVDGGTFIPLLLADEPETIVGRVQHPIDIFVSTAVFQHFPSREYGGRVLKTVRSMASPRMLGLVQIRFDNGNEKYRPKNLESYETMHLTATSYGIDEFWRLLTESGFSPHSVVNVRSTNNYATFLFRAKS